MSSTKNFMIEEIENGFLVYMPKDAKNPVIKHFVSTRYAAFEHIEKAYGDTKVPLFYISIGIDTPAGPIWPSGKTGHLTLAGD